jgi:hypothetical protein
MMKTFQNRLREYVSDKVHSGCDLAEIDALEQTYGVHLPQSYRCFLEVGGDGIDGFLTGSNYAFGELPHLQDAAKELLVENGAEALPDGAFVFTMHQGYQFFFFLGTDVYYYKEGASAFEKRYESFEQFFESVTSHHT